MTSPAPTRPAYRVYIIGPSGGFLLAHDLDCQTDEQALRKAKEYAIGNSVELWDRKRKIAFLPPVEPAE